MFPLISRAAFFLALLVSQAPVQNNLQATLPRICAKDQVSTAQEPCALPPHAIRTPYPSHTSEARAAKIEGTVDLSVVVNADGTPSDVKVVHGLGYGLDEASINTVQQWQFSPATIDGKPVAVKVNIETNFRLSTSPSDPGYPLHTPGPEYSLSLIEKKLQGVVQLDARIGEDGHVKEVSVVSGDAELAKATKKAVGKWFYQPFLADGKPTEKHLLITANFTLLRHPLRGQPVAAVRISTQSLP